MLVALMKAEQQPACHRFHRGNSLWASQVSERSDVEGRERASHAC